MIIFKLGYRLTAQNIGKCLFQQTFFRIFIFNGDTGTGIFKLKINCLLKLEISYQILSDDARVYELWVQ